MRSRSAVLPATASILPIPRIGGAVAVSDVGSRGGRDDFDSLAEVLHVFSSGFYLALSDPHSAERRLLPVMGPSAMALPFGLVVPELGSEHLADLRAGRTATMVCDRQPPSPSGSHRSFGGNVPIRRVELPGFGIDVVRHHRPVRVRPSGWANLDPTRIEALSRCLRPGIPDLPQLAGELVSTLLGGAATDAAAGVRALLGRGPGSTPSGDDALCGIALALFSSEQHRPLDLLSRTLDSLPVGALTPALSAALLDAAVSGHCVPAVTAAIGATRTLLTSADADASHISTVLASLDRVGHSSGHDLFSGFLAALAGSRPHRSGAPHSHSLTRHPPKGTLPCHAH